MASDAVQAILSRSHPPGELLRRVEPLLASPEPGLASLLPEVLNALGVLADQDAEQPLVQRLLDVTERLAPLDPMVTRRALRETLGLGWLFWVRDPLCRLLREAGEDLNALGEEAEELTRHADAHERRRGLALLCALGWATEEVASLDLDHAGWMDLQRARTLAGGATVGWLAEALSDHRPGVRMRVEAALLMHGANAAPAAKALLRMPAWPGEDGERPSPVLHQLPPEVVRAAMEGEEGQARRRAERVLGEGDIPFEEAFASWFNEEDEGRVACIEQTLRDLARTRVVPVGPLGIKASQRGLSHGLKAVLELCERQPPMRAMAMLVLSRVSAEVAVRPEVTPLLRKIFKLCLEAREGPRTRV